jgi:hypothetical protein
VAVVGDDGEGVAAEDRMGRAVGAVAADQAAAADPLPAGMHAGGGVEDPHLCQGGVQGDDVAVVHPQVGAERALLRRQGPLAVEDAAGLAGRVGPVGLAADAVLVPAFHGAAGAGAGIVGARPFVVAARHLVEHARADLRRVGHHPAGAQQVMRHGGQAEAGAGPLAALVQHRHAGLQVFVEVAPQRHLDQRRLVEPVAEIDGVGPRIELADDGLLLCHEVPSLGGCHCAARQAS